MDAFPTPDLDTLHLRSHAEGIKRCPKCGAGPIGNCGFYGCETPRNSCPLSRKERVNENIPKSIEQAASALNIRIYRVVKWKI